MNIILHSAFSLDDGLITYEQSEVIEFFLFFTDKKKNIIIDGVFSKILYSNQYFTMNGLYLKYARTPELFEAIDTDRITYEYIPDTRKLLSYDGKPSPTVSLSNPRTPTLLSSFCSREGVPPLSKDNDTVNQYEHLCNIEKRILELYSKTMLSMHEKKTPVYVFKNQLSSGYMLSYEDKYSSSASLSIPRTPTPRQKLRTSFCVSKGGRGFSSEALSKAESKAVGDDLSSKENRDCKPTLRNRNIEEENTVCVQYIKISGVWETELTYGITFKIISSRT
jgi:hypothetical protein